MVHTVALLGANGRIGSQILPHIVTAHLNGAIKLVVLTRPGSKVKNLHEEIEVREVDLEDAASLDAGLRGINTAVISISIFALRFMGKIIDALSRSPDAVTLIPSNFAPRFTPDQVEKFPALSLVMDLYESQDRMAEEKGVGYTRVRCGLFHDYFFDQNFINADMTGNRLEANAKQLSNPFPITNTEDLAKGIAELAICEPHSIRGKRYTFVSHWVSGNEIVDAFTKIHGSPTEVVDYDEAAKASIQAGMPGPVRAAYKDHWENGPEAFGFENEQRVSGRSFEQTASDALRNFSA